MKPFMRISTLVVLVAFAGCAHHRVVGYGKATVKLTRADAKELHEAFKTQAEKSVALPTLGEAKCVERVCRIPVQGPATVTEDGKITGLTKVRGALAFRPAMAALLVKLIDKAYETDKDQAQETDDGQLSCDGKGCVLEFAFPDRGEITADAVDGKARFLH